MTLYYIALVILTLFVISNFLEMKRNMVKGRTELAHRYKKGYLLSCSGLGVVISLTLIEGGVI